MYSMYSSQKMLSSYAHKICTIPIAMAWEDPFIITLPLHMALCALLCWTWAVICNRWPCPRYHAGYSGGFTGALPIPVTYHFIRKEKVLSLEHLNARKASFKYGPSEVKNKPTALVSISVQVVSHLKQSGMYSYTKLNQCNSIIITW